MARKVVVVDDEKPIADILEFNLKKEGYEVFCAYDGNDAVDLIYDEEPDIVLLDICYLGVTVWKYVVKYVRNMKCQSLC